MQQEKDPIRFSTVQEIRFKMSESTEKIRLLKCNLKLVEDKMESLENDVRCLTYQLSQARKKNKKLEDCCHYETQERLSQERKSETSLLFMFFHGCLCAAVITYAILNCQ